MNAAATNTVTRLSVCVRRNLCLSSSSLKRWRFLTTIAFFENSTRAPLRRCLAQRQVIVLEVLGFDAAEPEPNDSASGYWNRRTVLSIPPISALDTPKVGHRNNGKPRHSRTRFQECDAVC